MVQVLMRCYACCYGQGRKGVRTFRHAISLAATPEEFVAVIERDFPRE